MHRNSTFSLSPTVETLWPEIGRSRRFSKGVGHFERRFQREGASITNLCWCQKTRVIAVSCGIKISAVHHLVLSQYTELWQQYRALHYMQSHGKKCKKWSTSVVIHTICESNVSYTCIAQCTVNGAHMVYVCYLQWLWSHNQSWIRNLSKNRTNSTQ